MSAGRDLRMAVESENVQQVMAWLAQGGPARTANVSAETLVQKLAAVVFQGDAQWPERSDYVDAYRDTLRVWLGNEESQFTDLTKPDADPSAFVDWFLPVVVGWESATTQQVQQSDTNAAAGVPESGAATGLANPNFDGTAGTEFYQFDEATQEYQYSSSPDGADGGWATYDQRRYSEPARDASHGLTYRYDYKDNVYEWYDEPGQRWRNQAWADQRATSGHGVESAQPSQAPATGPSGPEPRWDESWKMFYRVESGGVYQFADAVIPGDESSGCGDTWLSYEQASARGAGRQQQSAAAASEPHAAAASAVHDALRAAMGSAFEAHPELRDVLTEEQIKAILADVAQEVIR
jgi:hypothetical protein